MVNSEYSIKYSVGTDLSDTLGDVSLGPYSSVWEPSDM